MVSAKLLCAVVAAITLLSALPSAAAPAHQEVIELPGLTADLNFKHYAGYVDATPGKQLFYWFVESQNDPVNDPLLIWNNGGPGSSSVGLGFLTEHGPFRVKEDLSVDVYPYSWNTKANVLYVESPSGVGFSYGGSLATNDTQTAVDQYAFLQNWFKLFSEYLSNDFYVTGESYGGHYCVDLATQIADGAGKTNNINLKGLVVGNPGVNSDWYYNVNEYAFVTYLYTHALLPQKEYLVAHDSCGWSRVLEPDSCAKDFTHPDVDCLAATLEVLAYVPKVFDPYDVLAKTCHKKQSDAEVKQNDAFVVGQTPFLGHLREKYGMDVTYNPCRSDYSAPFLNQPAVQKAIHVLKRNDGTSKVREWPGVGIFYSGASEKIDTIPMYAKFAKSGKYSTLIYSGDADSAVPFIGTQKWIDCLDRPVTKKWHNWMVDGDVAGSRIDYDGISFQTIKGCGHTVPSYCPKKGYVFVQNWLDEHSPSN